MAGTHRFSGWKLVVEIRLHFHYTRKIILLGNCHVLMYLYLCIFLSS